MLPELCTPGFPAGQFVTIETVSKLTILRTKTVLTTQADFRPRPLVLQPSQAAGMAAAIPNGVRWIPGFENRRVYAVGQVCETLSEVHRDAPGWYLLGGPSFPAKPRPPNLRQHYARNANQHFLGPAIVEEGRGQVFKEGNVPS